MFERWSDATGPTTHYSSGKSHLVHFLILTLPIIRIIVASLAFLVFEILLTFDYEYKYIWKYVQPVH